MTTSTDSRICGPKLTPAQVKLYKACLVNKGLPVRFLYRGGALDILTGDVTPRGTNVMYQTVYWNFTPETAREIAAVLDVRAVFDSTEGEAHA